MATRMQQRRGTAAQWVSTNSGNGPILNAGEIGFETDTNKFKIGDGTNHWINLDYFIDANSTVNPAFGSSIVFEGATANAFETTVQVTDPTADRTITLPDATGTVVLADGSGNVTVSGDLTVSGTTTTINSTTINATTGIVFEGTTANDFETTLNVTDPTADRTLTLPNETGTIATQTYVTNEIGSHASDTTSIHGIADTAELATKAYADTAASNAISTSLGTHEADTLSVHGITDTSLLVTTTGTQTLTNKTITTPAGLVKSDVGLGSVDNTADASKPVSTAQQTALDLKANLSGPTFTGTVTIPTLAVTTTATGITKSMVGLGNVDNTADTAKPVSTAQQTALDLKANLSGATFTGAVSGTSLTLSGDLTVNGTTTTLNSTTMSVDDKNIELGSVASPSDVTADGGGITLKGATDKTFNWVDATDSWTSSEHINLASGKDLKVNGTAVISSTAGGFIFTDGTQTLEGVPSRTPIIQKTDSYTLSALTERDSLIEVAKATATTITIPLNSAVAFPVGTSIDILQTSTGQVTIAGDAGVTVNSTPGLKLRTQWSSATLFKRAANTWVVYGDLTA